MSKHSPFETSSLNFKSPATQNRLFLPISPNKSKLIRNAKNDAARKSSLDSFDIDNYHITNKTEELFSELKDEETIKKSKNWKQWTENEKVLFFETIANAPNCGSLQNLFKELTAVKV